MTAQIIGIAVLIVGLITMIRPARQTKKVNNRRR